MMEAIRVEKKPTIAEFIALLSIFEIEFGGQNFIMPSEEYLQGLLLKEDFIVFVATLNHEVVGGLTGYILHTYYFEGAYFYVYDLAVHRSYQRKGIGTMLMKAVTDTFRNTNVTEVFVQAESDDAHAVEFYRSTRADEQHIVGFTYDLM